MTTQKTTEERILELENRLTKLENTFSLPNVGRGDITKKKLSAKEFLITKELKTEAQKTLALGYYLEYIEGIKSFNIDDLSRVFQSAKEKRPTNISDMVGKNVARGFIMEAPEKKDSKKAWVLTSTGEKFVEGL